jgi:uncharacterized membrane protein YidH (DUF202 family)
MHPPRAYEERRNRHDRHHPPGLVGDSRSRRDDLQRHVGRIVFAPHRNVVSADTHERDRTLMSVIRTSLSLIGFGFTIFQVFQKMHDAQILKSSEAPRHFGEVLVWLGIDQAGARSESLVQQRRVGRGGQDRTGDCYLRQQHLQVLHRI